MVSGEVGCDSISFNCSDVKLSHGCPMDSVDLNQSHEIFCYLGQLLGDQSLPLFLLFTLCGVFAPMFAAAYVY